MTDPKHLPPRDCMVLYDEDGDGERPTWLHVRFEDNQWFRPYGPALYPVDPGRVIDFREMDVMG